MSQIEVGILGATGMVGQQFIALLSDHPWFRVTWLGASQRSEGKPYRDATSWRLPAPLPDAVAKMMVDSATPSRAPGLVFSGLDSSVAGDIEGAFAQAGHTIVSNSRNFRMEHDVPLLIPEVNGDHLALLEAQASARSWSGRIVTNPNCAAVVLAMALAPLRQFGLRTAMITTLQAISGAGYPGVASWDILGNVIPQIGGGEEEKIETETKKILGRVSAGASGARRIDDHPVTISATTTRVPVQNGHTGSIAVALDQQPDAAAIIEAWSSFKGLPQDMKLPSAPPRPLVYLQEVNRPQPALDANRDGGMTVTVGRLRRCPVLGYKFVALGHNTIRGAAGAAILNAELMRCQGLL
ncbi:MAG TPA: aspartate-semialdehyde dehydrogenase [Vicinamibacterales bacterium]|nr:aspartate-semialdehyde dehydrogenase [Vicinamibacterales bacterium]